MDLKEKIEMLKNYGPTAGTTQGEYDFNRGYNYAMNEILKLIKSDSDNHEDGVINRLPPLENGYDPAPGNEFYKQVVNIFAEVAYRRKNEDNKPVNEYDVIKLVTDLGGELTSTFHPEGDTYTLITNKHYCICPLYKMVDVWNIGDYPLKRSIGRTWYKNIEELKHILETGIVITRFGGPCIKSNP